jgi:hypothetical protein
MDSASAKIEPLMHVSVSPSPSPAAYFVAYFSRVSWQTTRVYYGLLDLRFDRNQASSLVAANQNLSLVDALRTDTEPTRSTLPVREMDTKCSCAVPYRHIGEDHFRLSLEFDSVPRKSSAMVLAIII